MKWIIKFTITFSDKQGDGQYQDKKLAERPDAILVKVHEQPTICDVGKCFGNRNLELEIDEIKRNMIFLFYS